MDLYSVRERVDERHEMSIIAKTMASHRSACDAVLCKGKGSLPPPALPSVRPPQTVTDSSGGRWLVHVKELVNMGNFVSPSIAALH